jgi:ApbE superfamily uncharacterized protein (UPF0280 family)
MSPQRALLPGSRQHFAHGPIDLIISAEGDPDAVSAAHEQAWSRFATLLHELVLELPALQQPIRADCVLQGVVAQRMWHACAPYCESYITPMAAVAGAVAQEILSHYQIAGITRAWVNNGGDIALHLSPGTHAHVGLVSDLSRWPMALRDVPLPLDGRFTLDANLPVRGIATSGWSGRSFSLGIADSVTVLAATAAQADAAATVVANAVNIDDARITRRPACELKDNSDLGELLVTVNVPKLDTTTVHAALEAGLQRAQTLQCAGLIWGAVLTCQGHWRSTLTTASTTHVHHAGKRRLLAPNLHAHTQHR